MPRPQARTQDRPCADGLEQSALRLQLARRAAGRPRFPAVGQTFAAVILGRSACECRRVRPSSGSITSRGSTRPRCGQGLWRLQDGRAA